jgi:type II secretory pathway predicted ATPase ExeA
MDVEHLSHFGLSRDPFCNDALLSFYFEDGAFTEAERRLLRGATQGKGLCLLTGPGGSGKTMLVRHLLESLDEEAYESVLLIPMPGVSDGHWILDRFARQLGVEEPAEEPATLLGQLYEQLAVVREDGRRAVLIIDEAHVLADQGTLGELRGLLNLEYEERRLLTVVLAGLPHLVAEMAEGGTLAERVEIRVEIPSLDPEGSARYLRHRIAAVDGPAEILESPAIDAIARLAAGNPHRLNILADNSLYETYLAGRDKVTAQDVARAASDLGLSAEAPDSGAKLEEDVSVFDEVASQPTPAPPLEVSEVVAADTDPPVLHRHPGETIAILPDQGPPKDEEIDDLFVDLVDDP